MTPYHWDQRLIERASNIQGQADRLLSVATALGDLSALLTQRLVGSPSALPDPGDTGKPVSDGALLPEVDDRLARLSTTLWRVYDQLLVDGAALRRLLTDVFGDEVAQSVAPPLPDPPTYRHPSETDAD